MGRTLLFSCLVCLLSAGAALAQQPAAEPPAQAAPAPGGLGRLLNSTQDAFEQQGDLLRLVGRVELPVSGGKFFADRIDVHLDTDRLEAQGNVVFAGEEGRISADRVEFDLDAGTGTFHMASGIVSLGAKADRAQFGGQDPDVYFYGETVERLGSRQYKVSRGGFTTCVQPTPRWEVVSRSVVLNLDDYAFARNTVLKVKGVPLLYLPVMYYPIRDDDRATGFLLPTYGTSTIRGQAVSNAFFWAIGRSQDATFFHDWFTRSGQGGGAEYRYVADAQSSGTVRLYGFSRAQTTFTRGGVSTVLPASNSFQLTGSANQRVGRTLRARGSVDYFSDILTQQLYNQNVFQATQGRRSIEGGLSGTFGLVSTSATYQRSEVLTGATSSALYGGTPRLSASVAPRMLFGLPLYGSVTTDFSNVLNQQVNGGIVTADRTLNKWDLAPTLRLPLSRLTFLSVNTSASYRTTYYSRSVDTSGALTPAALMRQFLSVRSDVIGPVLTKIWDTPDSTRTERMKHVIEPAFAVDYTTEIANQARVPLLNDASDFVVGGTTRLTYGLTNRLFYRSRPSGDTRSTTREFLTVGVQQTYYSNAQASLFDTTYTSYSRRPKAVDLSPVALTARMSPSLRFETNARLEYDVSGNGVQVFSTGGTVTGATGSANVSYSRQRPSPASDINSYMSGSTSLRLREGRVRTMYALNWDIARAYVVSQTAMATYMAQCCGVQVEAQIFKFPQSSGLVIPSDRRFNVSFVLAGLGTFSNFFGAFGGLGTGTR